MSLRRYYQQRRPLIQQQQRQQDDEADRRRIRPIAIVAIVFALFMLALAIVLPITTIGSKGGDGPPPVVDTSCFNCPELTFTGFNGDTTYSPTVYGFVVCADDIGDVYFLNDEDNQRWGKLNISNPHAVTSQIITTTFPVDIGGPIGCAWNPAIERFLITDFYGEMHSLSKNGTMGDTIGNLPDYVRGITFVGDRLFGVGIFSNIIYEIDPTTGDEIASIEVTVDTALNGVYLNSIGHDSVTNTTYVSYRHDAFDDEFFINVMHIGRVDLQTGNVEGTCVTNNMHLIQGMTFLPTTGRMFASSGRRDNFKLYTMPHAPFPANHQEADSFTLICPPDYEGIITDNVLPAEFVVNGTYCEDGVKEISILDASDLPGGIVFSKKKKKKQAPHLWKRSSVSSPHSDVMPHTAAVNSLHNVQPEIITNETTKRQERSELSSSIGLLLADPGYYDIVYSYQNVYTNGVAGPNNTFQVLLKSGPTPGVTQLNVHVHTPSLTVVLLLFYAPVSCQSTSGQHVILYDKEANRFVITWVTESLDHICMAVTNTGDPTGTYDFFEFEFPGKEIDRFDIAVWGDYYTTCWNDLAQPLATRESHCSVFERDRILNGGGAPRVVEVHRPDIVETDGRRATATAHNQLSNNGPRGPLNAAFPCGVFSAITSHDGGLLNMVLCQSVNFDTSIVTTVQSITTVGSYDDGASGSCPAEDACIPAFHAPMDPHRYELVSAYRHFPNMGGGMERVVFAIVTNADGVKKSTIRMGSFIHNTDGSLTEEIAMSDLNLQFQDGLDHHVFSPAIGLSPLNYLYLNVIRTYTRPEFGNVTSEIITAESYSLSGNFDFYTFSSEGNFAKPATPRPGHTSYGRRYATPLTDTPASFYTERQRPNFFFTSSTFVRIADQHVIQKGLAIDCCNRTASCLRTVTLRVPNGTLPA